MTEISRTITRNEQNEVGPGNERGYRARVGTIGPGKWRHGINCGSPIKAYSKSPLFATEAEAREWVPPPVGDEVLPWEDV
ncbi:MAG: hypothetical protein U5N55_12740 [Cypionkella sp.]|nr:hypothetical protein [Cypionkella sp.]